jgi:hypothetical protein
VIDGWCVSSCANYVFPAGRRKWILPGSVVAWHGSVTGANAEDAPRAFRERAPAYLAAMRAKQDAFYERIGVSECITRFAHVALGVRGFFSMSIDDMERFGIRDILGGPREEKEIAEPWRSRLCLAFVEIPPSIDPRSCPPR